MHRFKTPFQAVIHGLSAAVVLLPLSFSLQAQSTSTRNAAATSRAGSRVSPAERIRRDRRAPRTDHSLPRTLDGYGNNESDPEMNAADTPLARFMSNDYADGFYAMAGADRPNARVISNTVFAQGSEDIPNSAGASDFVWQWGQFLDHDIDLTGGIDPAESVAILIPLGDPDFDDPLTDEQEMMDFNRSIYAYDARGIRQQVNEITGWIDASNVVGSDDERSAALRAMDGTGRLKTGPNNLLPNNIDGLENAGGPSDTLFLAGDVRANEQVALTAMHTLFMREHNRWADLLRSQHPELSGDELFERARALVAAEIQHITYTEFLPVLLGRDPLPAYSGYRPNADARVMNVFSTAAFRLGHSMLSATLLRLDENGQPIDAGHLPLRQGFFSPNEIRDRGIDPLLRGLAQQVSQDVDSYVIDDVRNFLFGAGSQGFDLVSLNIQRGRDHGLPSYNNARRAVGLPPAGDFEAISKDIVVAQRLRDAYQGDIEAVDLWVGGICEDKYRDSMLGKLFHTLVTRQFLGLRDGDRFWYTNTLTRADQTRVTALSLADIIRLNTDIGAELQDNVFLVPTGRPAPRDKTRRRRR